MEVFRSPPRHRTEAMDLARGHPEFSNDVKTFAEQQKAWPLGSTPWPFLIRIERAVAMQCQLVRPRGHQRIGRARERPARSLRLVRFLLDGRAVHGIPVPADAFAPVSYSCGPDSNRTFTGHDAFQPWPIAKCTTTGRRSYRYSATGQHRSAGPKTQLLSELSLSSIAK